MEAAEVRAGIYGGRVCDRAGPAQNRRHSGHHDGQLASP